MFGNYLRPDPFWGCGVRHSKQAKHRLGEFTLRSFSRFVLGIAVIYPRFPYLISESTVIAPEPVL